MIETRLLTYFCTVARERSITRAAQALYISQSTLSKQMADLEKQLGKTLFIRSRQGIVLTEEGTFLKERAQEVLRILESTEEALQTSENELHGDIHIAAGETAVMDRIAKKMNEFQKTYPDVIFHVYSANGDAILERIDKGLSDIGLVLGPIRQEQYDYLNLHQKEVYGLLMRKDCELASQTVVNIDQLKTLPILLADQIAEGHQNVDWFDSASVLNIVGTYNLIYNASFMVEHGMGYALSLKDLVNTENRNLKFLPIEPELSLDVYIVTKKYRTLSLTARRFLDTLRQSL